MDISTFSIQGSLSQRPPHFPAPPLPQKTPMPTPTPQPPSKPVMLYDGQCGFCRKSVVRRSGDGSAREVAFLPFQDAPQHGINLPPDDLAQSIHLLETNGHIRRGAEAILFAAAVYGRRYWARPLWWGYRRLPGFARFAETGYAFVARNRSTTCALPEPPPGRARGESPS